jgi:hypothetical protein
VAGDEGGNADDGAERQVLPGADAVTVEGVVEGLVAAQADDVGVERAAGMDGDGAGVMRLPGARREAFFAEGEQRRPGLVDGEALHRRMRLRVGLKRHRNCGTRRGERLVGGMTKLGVCCYFHVISVENWHSPPAHTASSSGVMMAAKNFLCSAITSTAALASEAILAWLVLLLVPVIFCGVVLGFEPAWLRTHERNAEAGAAADGGGM